MSANVLIHIQVLICYVLFKCTYLILWWVPATMTSTGRIQWSVTVQCFYVHPYQQICRTRASRYCDDRWPHWRDVRWDGSYRVTEVKWDMCPYLNTNIITVSHIRESHGGSLLYLINTAPGKATNIHLQIINLSHRATLKSKSTRLLLNINISIAIFSHQDNNWIKYLQSSLFQKMVDNLNYLNVHSFDQIACLLACISEGIPQAVACSAQPLYGGVTGKPLPPPLTGEQYGKVEPKYPEGGHCQSVLRPQRVFKVSLYFRLDVIPSLRFRRNPPPSQQGSGKCTR